MLGCIVLRLPVVLPTAHWAPSLDVSARMNILLPIPGAAVLALFLAGVVLPELAYLLPSGEADMAGSYCPVAP